MSNLSVRQTQVTQTIHTEVQVNHSQRVAPPSERMAPPSEMERDIVDLPTPQGEAQTLVQIPSEPTQPTSASNMLKRIVGASLLGGTASASVNAVAKSIATESFRKPSGAWAGIGVALSGGLALASVETGNQNLNNAKNIAAGALIGGSAGAAASSVATTIATNYMHGPGLYATAAAATLGAGLALASAEVEGESAKLAKNLAAGALIGGAGASLTTALVKTIATDMISKPSLTGIALGAAAGAGLAILSTQTQD